MKALVLTVAAAALCALAVPIAVADPALTGYPNSIASMTPLLPEPFGPDIANVD